MARFILLPAKALADAKTRLKPLLPDRSREAVALAMYCDVLRAVAGATLPDGVVVVTSDDRLKSEAVAHGFVVVPEARPSSLNRAVGLGTKACMSFGATTVVTLLTDIPLIEASDVDHLLAMARPEPSVLVVPSKEGTGTNALARTPPGVIRSAFGSSSLQRHLARAEQKGVRAELLEMETIGLDIDTPDDLLALARRDPSTCAQRLLAGILPSVAEVERDQAKN